jgi:hypothetical protein
MRDDLRSRLAERFISARILQMKVCVEHGVNAGRQRHQLRRILRSATIDKKHPSGEDNDRTLVPRRSGRTPFRQLGGADWNERDTAEATERLLVRLGIVCDRSQQAFLDPEISNWTSPAFRNPRSEIPKLDSGQSNFGISDLGFLNAGFVQFEISHSPISRR